MDNEHEKRLTETEARSKSNEYRLDGHDERFAEMEKRQNDLGELVSTVKVLADREERMEDDVKEIITDVKSLQEKPAKMWEKVVEKAIITLVAAVIGFLLARIGL